MVNYNKMAKKRENNFNEILEPLNEFVQQPAEAEPIIDEPVVEVAPEPATVEGVVDGCAQMYVRSEASADSEPLGIIKCGTKVQIYETDSTRDFYSVCTETGLEGFCMKKFIAVL